ncbi:hypothetical protein [Peribacillus sp. V2I11]|uniref:hypothetical protein n=1 Tax=Peribacillus sp. V2I11 TaxID=3042277 RepID=UPI0027827F09|nr:hypothetical protein [Peribacillus sp. V2I11]MDQ0884722.1 hypothetical protein [Peribacillus sp. V2I11]
MKKGLKQAIFAGALAVGVLVPTISEGAYRSYVGYVLPSQSGNNYTSTYEKETGEDYIHNKLENLEGTSVANFWAVTGTHSQLSDKYLFRETNIKDLTFNEGRSKGAKVAMAMENEEYWSTRAYAAGQVDFK